MAEEDEFETAAAPVETVAASPQDECVTLPCHPVQQGALALRAAHLPPLLCPPPSPLRRSFFKRYVMDNLTDFAKDSIKFLKGCRTPGDQRA